MMGLIMNTLMNKSEYKKMDVNQRCDAVLYHGPGHQSKAICEKTGAHSIHFARYGRYETHCFWKNKEESTGFFDDPPDGQDELEKNDYILK